MILQTAVFYTITEKIRQLTVLDISLGINISCDDKFSTDSSEKL